MESLFRQIRKARSTYSGTKFGTKIVSYLWRQEGSAPSGANAGSSRIGPPSAAYYCRRYAQSAFPSDRASSLREGSLNTRLAEFAVGAIESNGGTVDFGSMAEFDCPSYNADVQREGGFPAGADELRRRLEASDAFVICSPEYNASMPGVLKNAVDWVSRFHPQPFHERHALLLSASPSMVGGNRGVWALRVPFEHLGARIYPDMFSLARAHLALDGDGQIENEELRRRFQMTIASFMDLVEASKHYPCVKSAWVEYLGEHPEPAIDRVQ